MDVPKKILKDVPDKLLKEIVADFQSEGAEVSAQPQPNGNWTVEAVFTQVSPDGTLTKAHS